MNARIPSSKETKRRLKRFADSLGGATYDAAILFMLEKLAALSEIEDGDDEEVLLGRHFMMEYFSNKPDTK